MEFPRHLHQPEGRYVVVKDAETCERLLAGGWALQPEAHVEKPVEVLLPDALAAVNGAVIDFDESEPKAKKGRKAH